jgi:hypothetical protein
MPVAIKQKSSRTHPRAPSFVSLLSGWAQQGVQSFIATERILLDLVKRQNASVMHALREQLSDPHHSPTTILSEIAGEGVTNFIEGQKVLFNLAQEQNKILMTGVKERIGNWPAAHAVADTLRRSADTFIDTQKEFLKIAGKQTHTWVEAAKSGKPYQGEHLLDLAREGMENFVKAQKQFLDVIVEETEKATNGKHVDVKKIKKTELVELARQATDSFVDAQKKLFDVAGRQTHANVKAAGKTLELLKPFPFVPFAELTREGVKSYVDAQKALIDVLKGRSGHKLEAKGKTVHHAKQARRPPKKAAMAAHAVA